MANIINLITSGAGGLSTSADSSGTLNIQSAGSTVLALTSSGTTVTGTGSYSGNLSFNSGYGSAAVAYGCRAWVNFNGTGTVAIRASGNVSSITDLATGTYTVNFTNSLTDANYSGLITSGFASGIREDILGFAYTDAPYAPATGTYTIKFIRADTNAAVDTNFGMVAIFR